MSDICAPAGAGTTTLGVGVVGWIPEFISNKGGPDVRETPDHWLIDGADSYLVGEGPEDEERRLIKLGETMAFMSRRSFGFIEVAVYLDGSHLAHGTLHPDATNVWVNGDLDLVFGNLPDLAEAYSEHVDGEERVTVEMYRWDDPVPFRLIEGIEGVTFVRADGDAEASDAG